MKRSGVRSGWARCALVVLLAGTAVLVPATAAWAPHVPQLNVTPAQVRPGEQVTVVGTRGYGFTNPVEIRFNSPDGPVLGSFQPDKQSYAAWGPGTITIPADTKAGTYTLYATQQVTGLETHIRGIPARATIDVIGPGGAPVLTRQAVPPGQRGASELVRNDGPSGVALLMVGLGVAGLAMFGAGMAALAASRRRAAEAEAVR